MGAWPAVDAGGDLTLHSIPGYGTDAYLTLRKLDGYGADWREHVDEPATLPIRTPFD